MKLKANNNEKYQPSAEKLKDLAGVKEDLAEELGLENKDLAV